MFSQIPTERIKTDFASNSKAKLLQDLHIAQTLRKVILAASTLLR